jgi:hypothetical protein
MTRVTCPTFAHIEVVLCEDGRSLAAYAYPHADTDDDMVMVNLDDLPHGAFKLPLPGDD